MNNSDIDLIRKKASCLMLERKRLETARQRIKELEQDLKIKEYLNLVNFVRNNDQAETQKQFYNSINKIVSYTSDSNKLLFDYGYISVLTLDTEDSTCIHVYRDLETTEYYIEMIENKIEPMPIEWRIGHSTVEYMSSKKYKELRNYFIEQILIRPQEEIIEGLLETNKKLIKLK